jgi:hypothetical protein
VGRRRRAHQRRRGEALVALEGEKEHFGIGDDEQQAARMSEGCVHYFQPLRCTVALDDHHAAVLGELY